MASVDHDDVEHSLGLRLRLDVAVLTWDVQTTRAKAAELRALAAQARNVAAATRIQAAERRAQLAREQQAAVEAVRIARQERVANGGSVRIADQRDRDADRRDRDYAG